MSFPAMQSILVRGALQNVSVMYRNASYIADAIFPLINGLNYQTKVVKYAKQPFFTAGADFRAEGTVAKRIDLKVTTQNLDPRELAAGGRVTDELFFASNQPGNLPVQPITDTILLISDNIDLKREIMVANTIFGTSDTYPNVSWVDGAVGGVNPSGGAGFWAALDSTNTFVQDVLNAKQKVLSQTGRLPNTLMIDYGTFTALQYTQPIIDRVKYTQTGVVTEQLIAGLLGLDNVIVGKAVQSTTKENKAGTVTSMSSVWESQAGKGSAFLFYRPASAGMKQTAPGYQYRVAYDGQSWRRMISYREEWNHQTIYEVSEWIDIAPVSTDVGYLWKNTYSA
jgi:hypothetical protein